MIEDSVLELSEEILSFKTVSRFAVFEPKRNEPKVEQVGSVLIIQKSKAIILNYLTGEILYSYQLPKNDDNEIVDCCYIAISRSFCYLLKDSSIIVIAQESGSIASSLILDHRWNWPTNPQKVSVIHDNKLALGCSNGQVFKADCNSIGAIPPPGDTVNPADSNESLIECKSTPTTITTVCKVSMTDSNETSKRLTKKRRSAFVSDGNECNVFKIRQWRFVTDDPNKDTIYISSLQTSTRPRSNSSLEINEFRSGLNTSESIQSSSLLYDVTLTYADCSCRDVIALICHCAHSESLTLSNRASHHYATSLIFASSATHSFENQITVNDSSDKGNKGKWVKLSPEGTVMYERDLSSVPLSAVGCDKDETIWILYSLQLCCYSVRYAVIITTVALSSPMMTLTEDNQSTVRMRRAKFSMISQSSNEEKSSIEKSFLICRNIFECRQQENWIPIGSSIIRLSVTDSHSNHYPINLKSVLRKPSVICVDYTDGYKDGMLTGILESLSQSIQDELLEKLKLFHGFINRITNQSASHVVHDLKKGDQQSFSKRFIEIISTEAKNAFIKQCEYVFTIASRPRNAITVNDWLILKMLIACGDISTTNHKKLIPFLVEYHRDLLIVTRVDLLHDVLQRVSDLSENDLVQVLLYCFSVSDAVLGAIKYQNGFIFMCPNEEFDNDKKSKKKKKLSMIPKNGIMASLMDHFETLPSLHRIDFSEVIMMTVLKREDMMTSVVLSEALRKHVTPQFAGVLLHLFARILRQHMISSTSSVPSLRDLADRDISCIIMWIESLLDSHFSSFALYASKHSLTRQALSIILEIVSQVMENIDDLEESNGACLNMTRQLKLHRKGGVAWANTKPKPIYSVEKLVI